MKTFIYLLMSLVLIAAGGCKNTDQSIKTKPGQTTPEVNPYIDAFTSGNISRKSNIYLVFSQIIPEEKMNAENISKHVKIKPAIDGKWEFESNRAIVFQPEVEFQRNKTYSVTVNLSEWFDASGKEKTFTFDFTTHPLALRASLESLDITPDNDETYDAVVVLFTPDTENDEDVENLVEIPDKTTQEWSHNANGKQHVLYIKNIPAKEKAQKLDLKIAPNKFGIKRETLLSIDIPGNSDFEVYDIKYIAEPEQYIEITFNETLDDSQNLHGLAYIIGNNSETVTVDGNKLRLYPDSDKSGEMSVMLTGSIRSKKGNKLGEDKTYTVNIKAQLPSARFVGNGVIIPLSGELTVPFQAIYLRGVTVRVIRIMENNIGTFLQSNNLNGSSELMRVGRLIARKTIFLDEQNSDLSHWNTYAVDLRQLMDPEPGAIYRVELSFTRDLSAYPCNEIEQKTKEQIIAEDEIKFREELDKFDNGGHYYYYDEYDDWYNYDYRKRNDPCSGSYYRNRTVGRNVLATNLGLIAMEGENDQITIMVHNILNTKPERGVKVTLYNYQHQQIGTATSDDKGQATIKYTAGRPYYIIASSGKQKSYLRVDHGSSLSMSSFDVSGKVVQKGLKGFIYGERGVWRPGDIIHLGFMLDDRTKTLPGNHPVIMELFTPLGQLYARQTQTNNEMGLYTFNFSTEEDAETGAWHVNAIVGGVTFTKTIRIETIKPNRLKIEFDMPDEILLRAKRTELPMHAEWLQGATARNLKYELETTFSQTVTSFPKFAGYVFDDPSKNFSDNDPKIISGTTDDKGNATIGLRFDIGEDAPGMLSANIVTRVYEESGDFSIDGMKMQYSPYETYVGIKSPQKDINQLNTGTSHTFEVAAVGYTGTPENDRSIEVNVYKVQWHWWWSAANNRLANYISNSYNRPVKNFSVRTDMNGKATFELNFDNSEWGTYFVQVKDNSSGHSSGVMAYFDWPSMYGRRNAQGGDAATTINIKTDKDTYAPGEKIRVTFPSAAGSRAIATIENGTRLLSSSEYECTDKETTISIEATAEMQPNAYVHITLLQPYGAMTNDLPIRMYGVVPVTVTSPESRLSPVITMADEIRPESQYQITVSESTGREMAYTLAIVDEGLLDLTRFKTPDPWEAFNAREALGVNTWDLYNYVVGAYGGRIEQIFSIGGDDALEIGERAIVNRFTPVVVFDGPFRLEKGKKQTHSLEMPNYSGRVRVMVVAGDGEAYGNVDKSVLVRKPLMLLGTLPRVIGTNEEMSVPATVFAMKDGMGDVKVSIKVSDNMEIAGDNTQTLNFSKTGDKQAKFRIRVKDIPGTGRITITASAKGETAEYATDIEIRSVRLPQVKVENTMLKNGEDAKWDIQMPGTNGTNTLTLETSSIQPLNLTSRLNYLLGYPHGCIEQITSKGFPQLYLKEFASLTKAQEQSTQDAVKEVIRRMRSYLKSDGMFSYWPGSTEYYSWASTYAVHFILEAEANGYLIPESLKRDALAGLKRAARNWKPEKSSHLRSERMTQAYRLFVLTLAGETEMGAMNRLREGEMDDMTRWLLAAAYANAGRTDVARELTTKTTNIEQEYNEYDQTFGSDTRDKAIKLITLTIMDDAENATPIADEISKELGSDEWMSTQTTAFSLMAMSKYMKKYSPDGDMSFSYKFNGKEENVTTSKSVWSATLAEKAPEKASLEVKNTGKAPLFVRIITEGTPEQGEEKAYSNGITISVDYKTLNSKSVDVTSLKQGTNFTASVTIKNPSAKAVNNLVLTQIFPAGWEILNTRFLNEDGDDETSSQWLSYQDIRDDRVYSYMDRLDSGRQITVEINVTAVYPGLFYLPPVYCEAMYDHLIRANTEGKSVTVE